MVIEIHKSEVNNGQDKDTPISKNTTELSEIEGTLAFTLTDA